jgi:hypothetical protein
MDTRNKIIPPDRAALLAGELRDRGAAVRVVTGYFDVLVADHVRRLREIAARHGQRCSSPWCSIPRSRCFRGARAPSW